MEKLTVLILVGMLMSLTAVAEGKFVGTIPTDGVRSKTYSSLAKISLTEASSRASAVVPGKVSEVALESEDGYLVYSVEIINADHTKTEVLIDAGNGSVLSTEHDD